MFILSDDMNTNKLWKRNNVIKNAINQNTIKKRIKKAEMKVVLADQNVLFNIYKILNPMYLSRIRKILLL